MSKITSTKRQTLKSQQSDEFALAINDKISGIANEQERVRNRRILARQLYQSGRDVDYIARKLYRGTLPAPNNNSPSHDPQTGNLTPAGRDLARFEAFKRETLIGNWLADLLPEKE